MGCVSARWSSSTACSWSHRLRSIGASGSSPTSFAIAFSCAPALRYGTRVTLTVMVMARAKGKGFVNEEVSSWP